MNSAEWFSRWALAATLTTAACIPLALMLLRVCGVPATYPPLLPQQILAGTLGGSLLVAAGYALLAAIFPNTAMRHRVFLGLAVVLCLLSFQLAARLSYTTSPRFAGVTLAAQVGQCLLHTMVVFLSSVCFLTEKSEWG